jgi:hypothetical protein
MLQLEPLESRCLLAHYTLTDLGDFHAFGLNDWNLVAGVTADYTRPALWYQGQVTELPKPDGFTSAEARAVNDWGEAAGVGIAADGTLHALFWDRQGVVDLGPGFADAINDRGQLAGDIDGRAARWSPYRSVEVLDVLSQGLALNDAGQVAGVETYFNGQRLHTRAFRWQPDGSLDLLADPTDPTRDTKGSGINAAGDVVGSSFPGVDSEPDKAVDWSADDRVTVIDVSNSAALSADTHRLVGQVVSSPLGASYGFIWDHRHGLRNLNDLTPDHGDLNIYAATQITDAGTILVTLTNDGNPARQGLLMPVHQHEGPAPAWIGWALALQEKR